MKTEEPEIDVSRSRLLWGAGPALACGFWIYALWPRLFQLTLDWAGIRTLVLVGICSLLQFGSAALPQPLVRKILGIVGWCGAAAALVFLIVTLY